MKREPSWGSESGGHKNRQMEGAEFYTDYDHEFLKGEITLPTSSTASQQNSVYTTLDEPISETIIRDLKDVGTKFWHVFYPRQKQALLRNWDLWGPLFLCIFLALMLEEPSKDNYAKGQGGLEFAEVFVVVCMGAIVVTINSKLLGGTISLFQCVCVLGYCLVPQAMSLVICQIILFAPQSFSLFVLRSVVTVVGFTWATFAAMIFLGDSHPANKKGLAVFPVFLFYFVISWMILSHSVGS